MRQFQEYLSIRPNKIVIYTRELKEERPKFISKFPKMILTKEEMISLGYAPKEKTSKKGHNFQLSKQARTNIQEKINWLFYFAKARTITTNSKKVIKDFKINFITLTLPSQQKHTSDFITKNCLNQLLQELRTKANMINYVWRLEYQKNGNLHYHIVTDVYISHIDLRNYWNRILEKFGYVSAYSEKMKKYDFVGYNKMMNGYGKTDIQENSKSFAKGVRENWKNPNSTDCIFANSGKNIGGYIAKYFGKNEQANQINKLESESENSQFSRLWFCSQSLSKCDKIASERESFNDDIFGHVIKIPKARLLVCEYCTIIYFEIESATQQIKDMISSYLKPYGTRIGYLA